ncbi:penicillin-insensitive murein endopeptidase [Bdellovibrionota bacterium FG-1]
MIDPVSLFKTHFFPLVTPLLLLVSSSCLAQGFYSVVPDFGACGPESDDWGDLRDGLGLPIPGSSAPRLEFCAEWNPEFGYNGHRCCSRVMRAKGRRGRRRLPPKVCARERFKADFCDEMTDEQLAYTQALEAGKIPDILGVIHQELGRKGEQAFCTVNNGFLAWGRPVLPTATNRILLRSPERCTNYGTDPMAGLMEWLGRQVAKQYADDHHDGVRLVVGDISAPRGGCLAGRSGPKGHASHTTGQDADIGFLTVHPGRLSPQAFHNDFDGKINWWLVKQLFKNPYACVKVVFLDKKLIRKLAKTARGDADWGRFGRFIRHMPAHKNHFHIRIGDVSGLPGCSVGATPEDETGEGGEGSDGSVEGVEEDLDFEALDLPIGGSKAASAAAKTSTE